jgi:dolichyl-phosphate-mannose--protein O-mannosyl transferase
MAGLIGLTFLSASIFGLTFITGDSGLYRHLVPWAAYAKPAGLAFAVLAGVPFLFQGVRNALHILIDITSHFYRPKLRPWGDVTPGDF